LPPLNRELFFSLHLAASGKARTHKHLACDHKTGRRRVGSEPPRLKAMPEVAWCMKFDDWLFWAAFLGFLGCNVGLLAWVLLG